MPRVKIKRKSTTTDMTAMCDVAFLLLTFFILTAKAKTEDPVPVDIPSSSVNVVVPDENLATLIVGQDKVFFDMGSDKIKAQTLSQMASKYKIGFTKEEVSNFSNMNSFGVPMSQLKQLLDMDPVKVRDLKQPGIPADTTETGELYNWIREARIADKALNNKELRIAIKGDNKEQYPTIKKIVTILTKQKVNKFSLITSLKTAKK
jgi:biopolymer transport protein ExbD